MMARLAAETASWPGKHSLTVQMSLRESACTRPSEESARHFRGEQKVLESARKSPLTSCAWHAASTTEVRGSDPMRAVPHCRTV